MVKKIQLMVFLHQPLPESLLAVILLALPGRVAALQPPQWQHARPSEQEWRAKGIQVRKKARVVLRKVSLSRARGQGCAKLSGRS